MNDDGSHVYRWVAYIDRLASGDITKHDIIYERNYIECLNLLSYWFVRDKQIEQMNKINNN